MSGPIVRRYGFPNFDKIFGERPLEHGVEESEQPEDQAGESGSREEAKREKSAKPKGSPTEETEDVVMSFGRESCCLGPGLRSRPIAGPAGSIEDLVEQ